MRYSDEIIEEIRSSNDIIGVISSYTSLKQKGNQFFGLCPFHKENTPSFSVSGDKQLYHCFGCGASGNVVTFVMQKENLDFVESIKHLADRAHITLPEANFSVEMNKNAEMRASIYEIHTKVARLFHDFLMSDDGKEASDYLDKRDVSLGVRKKFGLGYSFSNKINVYKYLLNEGYDIDTIVKSGLVIADKKGGYFDRFNNRLMFPILNVHNKVVGFGGRIMDKGEPKYLNSPETPIFDKSKNLFGLNFVRKVTREEVIIVEGYMDVISLYQYGIKNAVASLGTAFNADHANLLRKYCKKVILLFDSDKAGETAALRAIPVLVESGLSVKVLQLVGEKDPDDFVKKYGQERFLYELSNAVDYITFQVNMLKKNFDVNDPVQKIQFTKEVSVMLAKLDSPIERDVFIQQVSKITDVSLASIKSQVDQLVDTQSFSQKAVTYKNKPLFLGDKGLDEAKRSVIFTIGSNANLAFQIRKHLKKEELSSPFYEKLYNIMFDILDKGKDVYFADLINNFEELEEQRLISSFVNSQFNYDDKASYIKALNDQIWLIKTSYLDEQINLQEDVEKMLELIEMRKNHDNIRKNTEFSYITALDG